MQVIRSIEEERKQDGNRSIADKILKRLHDLEKTVEVNYGRWIWELLQNAKDSLHSDVDKVDIWLKLTDGTLEFSHNASYFTEQDIRGLINQISSKETEEGAIKTNTGRFGTGFITTHLLSKCVTIEGVVESRSDGFLKFNFLLDRNGSTTQNLAPKIDEAWNNFYNSAERIELALVKKLHTKFTYSLNNSRNKEIAQKGITEFINLIPYVMTFIPQIGMINIELFDKCISFVKEENSNPGHLLDINKSVNGVTTKIRMAYIQNETSALAVEINPSNNAVKKLNSIPKLFCDFPLIGTEFFPFPVVLNSFFFNPKTERDGIWLTINSEDIEVKENKKILESSVYLYKELLNFLSRENVQELYYIVNTKTSENKSNLFDENWYNKYIQNPLREIILKTPIVDTVKNGRVAIIAEKSYVDFPYHSKIDVREKLWELVRMFSEHFILPKRNSIHEWYNVLWDDKFSIRLGSFAEYLSKQINLGNIINRLSEESDVFDLLNRFYQILLEENKQDYFNKNAIIPNQEGNLCKLNSVTNVSTSPVLYYDNINDNALIDIAVLLGLPIKEKLIHSRIIRNLTSSSWDKSNVAPLISKHFNVKPSSISESWKNAIIMIAEWFDKNPIEGQELFPNIYKNRASLFLDTIEDKESLYSIMKSNTSLSELAELSEEFNKYPELLLLVKQRLEEIQEELDRNEIGETVEKVIAELLKDYNFCVKKVVCGRDLIISIEGNSLQYNIEVKSTRAGNFITMTPAQAISAINNPSQYALCVVKKEEDIVTKEFVKENAKFVIDIGKIIADRVKIVGKMLSEQKHAIDDGQDISLLVENELKFKYKIKSNIWNSGKSFLEFINYLKTLN